VPNQSDLFPQVKGVTVDEDGSFALRVHPETAWTVYALPIADNGRLRVEQAGIVPGSEDVVLRITDADLAGCVVRGTVLRADGQPLGDYAVEIVNYEDGKPSSSGDARAKLDGSQFTLPALSLGNSTACA
jgi:hypothetical protein